MGVRKTTMMDCDAPGCTVSQEHSRDDAAFGYHLGRVVIIQAGGGTSTKPVFACKIDHIEAAIAAAEEEAWK